MLYTWNQYKIILNVNCDLKIKYKNKTKPRMIPESKVSMKLLFLDKLLGTLWLSSHLQCGVIFPSQTWKYSFHVSKYKPALKSIMNLILMKGTKPQISSLSWLKDMNKGWKQINVDQVHYIQFCVQKQLHVWRTNKWGHLRMHILTQWFLGLARNL